MLQYKNTSYPSFFKTIPGCVNCKKHQTCTLKLFRTESDACGDIEYKNELNINSQNLEWHFFQLQKHIDMSINSLNTTSDRLFNTSCRTKDGPTLTECRILSEVLKELMQIVSNYEEEYLSKLNKYNENLEKITSKNRNKGLFNTTKKQKELQEKIKQHQHHFILYLENICSMTLVCENNIFHVHTTDEEFLEILANKNICFKLYNNEVTIPVIQNLKYKDLDGMFDGTDSNIEERGKEVFGDI